MQNPETFALLHVSDTHLTTIDKTGTGVNLRSVLSQHPDLPVLITGDLAGDGEIDSYRELLQILGDRTYLCCPGNHDNTDNLRSVLGDSRILDTPTVRIIAVNSCQTGAVAGRIGGDELVQAERAIAESERPCIVALHHPPNIFEVATVPGVLLEAESTLALAEVIGEHASTVLGVVCGHLHQPMLAPWAGTHVFVAPSSAYHLRLYNNELYKAAGGGYAIHRVSRGSLVSTVENLALWDPTEETLRRRRTCMT